MVARRKFENKNKSNIRERLARRDGYKCLGCHTPYTPQQLTIDHIIPIRDGGSHHLRNLRLLCDPCHTKLNKYEENALKEEAYKTKESS